MIEQQATIVEVDGDTVWLQAERESTCSNCQVKQGCGTGLLSKHVGKKEIRCPQTDQNLANPIIAFDRFQ